MSALDHLAGLVRPGLLRLKPYSSARDEFDSTGVADGQAFVYLDANENPYPSPYNRYPDPHQRKLKERLASIKNVPANSIFLGNGSDEAIDLLLRIFCRPGVDNVIIPSPTYGMYQVSAEINDVVIKNALLTEKFDIDASQLSSMADANTRIIFLCSPNNPTGNLLSENQVSELLASFPGIVVVDEAYIDFALSRSWSLRLNEFPRLVVLQTLSKAWGLAGLRLGLALSSPEIIALMDRIKPPYNINTLTQQIAFEALGNESAMNISVANIRKERKRVAAELTSIRSIQLVHPSDANFLLVRITDAAATYKKLVAGHIIVRDRSQVVLCDECLRITIGTPAENDVLLSALRKL